MGKRYGAKWIEKGFWFLKSNHIKKTRNFMDAHGAKSVFIGRFVPSAKEIIPFIAGSVKMNKKTFMFWNILGGIGWGFEWVFAGYIFAQSLNLAQLWLSRAGLFFAFLVITAVILYFFKWLIIKKGKQLWLICASLWQSITAAVIDNAHVAQWIRKHPRIISFLKARLDTKQFSGLPLSLFTMAFVYALALFAGIVEDLITFDPIIAADIRIANLAAAFRTDTLTNIVTWITLLGKSQVILGFIAILVILLWLWRLNAYIISLFISVCGSEILTYLGKLAFHRPRPALAVYVEHSYSFPSGHATIAVAFYGFLGYLFMHFVQSWNKKVNILFAAILIIIAIGFSRVYLGEHYISDVWSGYLVGSMWLIIAVSFSEWLRHKKKGDPSIVPARGARPISFLLVLIAIAFYTGFSITYHPPTAPVPIRNIAVVSQGTDVFTNEQRKYTETLIGDKQEPINIIFFAGNDRQLVEALQAGGWILTDRANLPSFTKAVKALLLKIPYPSAPMSPSFWNARMQDMSFAKIPGVNWVKKAHHLQIWRTDLSLKNGNTIYVGSVNANDGFTWGIIPKISPDLDTERELLRQDLDQTGKIESCLKVQLVKPLIGNTLTGDPFFTDGNAYAIGLH